jgi:tRNA nucleotidyltransferase (CCA-adding enzyme)
MQLLAALEQILRLAAAYGLPMTAPPTESVQPAAVHFPHGADIGVRGTGPTVAAAFEQAALAMMAVITDPPTVRLKQTVEIICAAPNAELLLLDWLNAIIFEVATRSMIFGAFEVKTDGKQLHGMAHGEPISRERHKPAVEITGATFTELRVIEESPGHWQAQCVVDV